jgi:hypothetical protein
MLAIGPRVETVPGWEHDDSPWHFRLNWSGMGAMMDAMNAADVLDTTTPAPEWPDFPGGAHLTDLDEPDEFGNVHAAVTENRVTHVHVQFTPQEWCDLAMREGRWYIGGCCGTTGAMQDIVNAMFRDSGHLRSGDLIELADLAISHDGFDEFGPMTDEQFDAAVTAWQDRRLDPYAKLGVIFNSVRDLLVPDSLARPRDETLRDPQDAAINTLANTLRTLSWSDLFRDDTETDGQHQANQHLARAKALPLARQLIAALETNPDQFSGFAIVAPSTDRVLSNGRGSCVYSDHQAAEDMVALWAKQDDPPEMEIVPVTVSVDDGLVVHRD